MRSLQRWDVCCLAFIPFPHMSACGYLFNTRQTQCNQMPLCSFFGERQHTKLDSLTNNIWTEDRLDVSQWVKNYRKADRQTLCTESKLQHFSTNHWPSGQKATMLHPASFLFINSSNLMQSLISLCECFLLLLFCIHKGPGSPHWLVIQTFHRTHSHTTFKASSQNTQTNADTLQMLWSNALYTGRNL